MEHRGTCICSVSILCVLRPFPHLRLAKSVILEKVKVLKNKINSTKEKYCSVAFI